MKRKTKVTFLLIFTIIMTLLVVGCQGTNKSENDNKEKPDTTGPQEGGQLVVGLSQVPKTLDPVKYTGTYESNIMNSIYDTLVAWTDDQQKIVGSLATDWKVSDNLLEYTFTLRDNVYFHDGKYVKGRKLTAEDVKYSLERSATQSAMGRLSDLKEAVVVDEKTVKLILKQPNAAFLARLTDPGNGIVPKEEVEGWGDEFGQHPVGTGPFVFDSWAKDDNVTLVRNEKYWVAKPHLEKLVFKFIPDQAMMSNALLSGDIDIATDVAGPDRQKLKADKNITIQTMPGMNVYFAAMNMQKGPTADIRVRKAIAYALDVDAAVKNIFQFGGATRAYVPLPKKSWGYDPALEELAIKERNVEKAKELLKEAGYENGFKTTIVTPNKPYRVKWAQIMQTQLAEVGIQADIEKLEWGSYSDKVSKGEAPIYLLAWTWFPDPDFFLFQFFHKAQIGRLGNGQGFLDEEVSALIDEAKASTIDQEKRKALYKQVMEKAMAQVPRVEGWHKENINGIRNRVQDYNICPDDQVRIVTQERNVWVKQ